MPGHFTYTFSRSPLHHRHLAFTEAVLRTAMAGVGGTEGCDPVTETEPAPSTGDLLAAVRQWQDILQGPSGLMSLDALTAPIGAASSTMRDAVAAKAQGFSAVLFKFYGELDSELKEKIETVCLRVYGTLYSKGLLGELKPDSFPPLQVRPELSHFPYHVFRALIPLLDAEVRFAETTVLEESLTLLEGIKVGQPTSYSRSQDLLLKTLTHLVAQCDQAKVTAFKASEQSLVTVLKLLEQSLAQKFQVEEAARQEAEAAVRKAAESDLATAARKAREKAAADALNAEADRIRREAEASAAASAVEAQRRASAAGSGGSPATGLAPEVTPAGIADIAPANLPSWAQPMTLIGDVVELTGRPGVYAVAFKTDKVIALLNSHGIKLEDLLKGGTFTKQDGKTQTLADIAVTDIGNPASEYRGYLVNLDFWRQEAVRHAVANLPEFKDLKVDFFEKAETEANSGQLGTDLSTQDIKFYKSGKGWFWAPEKTDKKLVNNPLQRQTSLVGYRLGYWFLDIVYWYDYDPFFRNCNGGSVLRIQR